MTLHLIIKKGYLKKRAPRGAAFFHALSNKKKYLYIERNLTENFGGDDDIVLTLGYIPETT